MKDWHLAVQKADNWAVAKDNNSVDSTGEQLGAKWDLNSADEMDNLKAALTVDSWEQNSAMNWVVGTAKHSVVSTDDC